MKEPLRAPERLFHIVLGTCGDTTGALMHSRSWSLTPVDLRLPGDVQMAEAGWQVLEQSP